jgi:hypothetical protein
MDAPVRKAALLAETRLIGFGAATRVIASDVDLRWLGEFFEPSLGTEGLAVDQATVTASVDANRFETLKREFSLHERRLYDCFTLDGSFDAFSGCHTAQGELLISLDRFDLMLRVGATKDVYELVAGSTNAKVRMGLMRVVREIATVRALRAGGVPLHGSACARQGGAFGFLGHKTAGKTTSLIHWLQSEETRFLANDRFFLFRRRGGWVIRGMPTIVKLRPDTLQLFDDLPRRATEYPFDWNRTLAEVHAAAAQGSPSRRAATFTQTQFLRIMDRSAVAEAPLRMLLFPERDDSLDVAVYQPLSPRDAVARLEANLLSPGTLPATAEVFDPEPNREIALEPILGACREVADSGCCFAYRQGIRTLSRIAASPVFSRVA